MTRLEAHNLACRRGSDWLFKNLSFRLDSGQMMWLRGTNGSGKTTLLRVLAGLTHADEGSLSVGQADSARVKPQTVERLYIGHANGLKDDLTVTESLQFLARLHDKESTVQAVHTALRRMGVHHRRNAYVRTLSQGQKRRVALARLVLDRSPSLWILDEPFDALDAAAIDTVYAEMIAHLTLGGSVIFTSHVPVDGRGAKPKVLDLGQDRTV
jgi:heme exporter protein A